MTPRKPSISYGFRGEPQTVHSQYSGPGSFPTYHPLWFPRNSPIRSICQHPKPWVIYRDRSNEHSPRLRCSQVRLQSWPQQGVHAAPPLNMEPDRDPVPLKRRWSKPGLRQVSCGLVGGYTKGTPYKGMGSFQHDLSLQHICRAPSSQIGSGQCQA